MFKKYMKKMAPNEKINLNNLKDSGYINTTVTPQKQTFMGITTLFQLLAAH